MPDQPTGGEIGEKIREIWQTNRHVYGAARVHAEHSSTATPGRPAASSRARSSTMSKRSTTRADDTPRSGCSPRPTREGNPLQQQPELGWNRKRPDCPRNRGKTSSNPSWVR